MGIVTRMGLFEDVPVIGKDLLEDTPVPGDLCHHWVAPSEGDQVVWVKRFYHDSTASSNPYRLVPGHPQPTRLLLSHRVFWESKNEKSYVMNI